MEFKDAKDTLVEILEYFNGENTSFVGTKEEGMWWVFNQVQEVYSDFFCNDNNIKVMNEIEVEE